MSELDSLIDAVPDFTATEPKKKPRAPLETLVDKVPDFTQGAPSTGDDVLRTLPWIAPKAAAGFMGLPHDINALSEEAGAKVESMLPDSMQVPAWLRTINEALDSVSPLKQISRALPGAQDVRGLAEKATGPWYDPQTRTGKVVDTAGQTALTMGRNWLTTPVKAAAMTGAITAGTETAGALSDDNPWARLVGGLAGGGIPTAVNVARGRVGNTIRASVGDVTPAQEAAALELQARGQAEGVPLTGTESLDAGHGLAGRTVATLGGGQTMHEFTRDRPAQVAAAVDRRIIAPTGNTGTPSENAARAQTAATGVIDDAETARSAAVRPYYDAARRDVVSPDALQGVSDAIANQRPFFPLPGQQSALNRFSNVVDTAPGMNASTVDALYKGARAESELPAIGATAEAKQAAAAMGPVTAALKSASEESANLVGGRKLYQDITRDVVDPLNAGPIGKVAGKGYDPAALPAVDRVTSTVSTPTQVRPSDIRTMYTHLNAKDAKAFPGIAKTWIENEVDAAVAPNRSGPNATAGSKLHQALYGSPQQRANFEEVMRGVAHANGVDPKQLVAGARNLMSVLERTGRTPGIGSQTQPRAELGHHLQGSLVADVMDSASLSKPLGPFAERVRQWANQGRDREIARILTAPDSVEQIVKLAKLRPNGLTARYYVAALLGLDRATSADGP